MGKHEFMTPKAIANRIKAKGLQKLRWYCQLCEKQCRDENGFKCHCQSEGHLRQMRVFSENPGRMVSGYSREFESSFLSLLRVRGPKQKVFANQIYQEMIKDRNHVHMKATCWTTLSGFVQYLGKTGKAIIEEAPRGWYITYVEKDPDVLEMQRKARDMEKIEMSEQERNEKRIQMQVEHAYKSLPQSSSSHGASSSHELKEASNQPLKLGFKSIEQKKTRKIKSIFEDEDLNEDLELLSTAADEFAWITPNIIVKILNPDIEDGAFYKQKGVIVNVHDQFIAEIKLLKLDAVVRIDQVELETVLPAIGNDVLFVGKGIYNGLTARLEGIDEKSYSASITFTTGDVAGKTIHGVEYEQICKLNSAESKKP